MRVRILALVLIASVTCTPNALQVQARLANSVALAGNATLTALLNAYRVDGLAIIAEARAAGLPREEAERRLQAHVRAWVPVWGQCDDETGACTGGAWPALRATHDAWAEALELQMSGRPLDLAAVQAQASRMHAAYCAVRAAVPEASRASIPLIPGVPCP